MKSCKTCYFESEYAKSDHCKTCIIGNQSRGWKSKDFEPKSKLNSSLKELRGIMIERLFYYFDMYEEPNAYDEAVKEVDRLIKAAKDSED